MTNTFLYKKWKPWLESRASELQTDDVKASISYTSENTPKPGFGFTLAGVAAAGVFQAWITGEIDYTIHSPPVGSAVSHQWGRKVIDDTFEALFNEFVNEFSQWNTYTESKISAEAEIKDAFVLNGRGLVLVLKAGWTGKIPPQGILKSEPAIAAYVGPEYLRHQGGKEETAVVIDAQLRDKFSAGQQVKFFAR